MACEVWEFFEFSPGRERTPPPELYSFAYKALQPRKMGSSEPEVQGIHGRRDKIKQHNTPTTHKTSHTAGGEQEGKTQHNTTKSTAGVIERHRPAETKPRHCTVDVIERLHATETAQRRDTTCITGHIRRVTRGRDDATPPVCHRVVEGHRQADQTMTLHRRCDRQAPCI